MLSNSVLKDVINKLKSALTSGDLGLEYDALTLAYRLYGAAVPKIEECFEEAKVYSGTAGRNTEITIKLLEAYEEETGTSQPKEQIPLLNNIEKGIFLKLFNRGGYVLDFTTNDFDVFTMESVGVALCKQYNQSKGKSLVAFIHEADNTTAVKLLLDLFEYYEENYSSEYQKKTEDAPYYTAYKEEYAQLYQKCKAIVKRIIGIRIPLTPFAEDLKERFSTEYMNQQIELLLSLCDENPTEAIGKSKEFIESCCITILDDLGIAHNPDWDVGQLAGEALKQLKLTPRDIPEDIKLASEMKAIMGNLRAIATNIALLRNAYGSGHGKAASYKGLEKRHARLAVGSSITFVEFLWASHERNTE